MQPYEPEYQAARTFLLEEERNRRNLSRRSLFWNAAQWARYFSQCVAGDQRRDVAIQQQLASATGVDHQGDCIQLLYDMIESDIAWYRNLLTSLQATHHHWETDGSVEQERVDELSAHEAMVEAWLYERRIAQHQLSIEYLEQQRRAHGSLGSGAWTHHWSLLLRAWSDQDLFYHRLYGPPLASSILTTRRTWCQHIRTFQQTTESDWSRSRSCNRQELNANAALVQAEIAKYSPRLKHSPHWRRRLMIATVVSIIGLLLWFNSVASGQLRRDRGTPDATPTARVAGGIFSKPPTATPPPLASQSAMPTATLAAGTTIQSQSEQLNAQGLALLIQGNCHDAIGSFQAAIEADASFYEPPNNLAFCLFEAGDLQAAIAQWQRSIHLKPDNADGYAGLATALYVSGQEEAALMNYRHALEINAQYSNESWLRTAAFWSERAITASAPLRTALR